jgi:hypothetical protein
MILIRKIVYRFQNRRAKWRKREKALGRESPNFMGPHDLETFRHQMSTYLSNALTGTVAGTNANPDRSQLQVPPSHYLPFLMGHIDEKVLTRLPTPSATHSNLGLLYHHHHHHPIPSSNINISSASPTSSSSNSSTPDIHEQTSSYLTTFDHHRRVKLEIQDATA